MNPFVVVHPRVHHADQLKSAVLGCTKLASNILNLKLTPNPKLMENLKQKRFSNGEPQTNRPVQFKKMKKRRDLDAPNWSTCTPRLIGCICLSEGVHVRLAIEGKKYVYILFISKYSYIHQ